VRVPHSLSEPGHSLAVVQPEGAPPSPLVVVGLEEVVGDELVVLVEPEPPPCPVGSRRLES